MIHEERILSGQAEPEDLNVDQDLRPKRLAQYIGQELVKKNLEVFIQAARARKEALDHVLFHGFPGLGKTTLAYIIAHEMESNIKVTSGPVIERQGDLAAIQGDIRACH